MEINSDYTNQLLSSYKTTTAGLGSTSLSNAATTSNTTSTPILSFATSSVKNVDTFNKNAVQANAVENDDEEEITSENKPGTKKDVGVESTSSLEKPDWKRVENATTTRDVSVTQTGADNVQPPEVQKLKITGIKVENDTVRLTGESSNADGSTSNIKSEIPKTAGKKQEFYRLVKLTPEEQAKQNQ